MLKKNDEIELTIKRLGADGEGVATYENKVVFVPFALAGERVLVHIISCKKDFYVGKLISVLEASPKRIKPPCPYFSKCGGCAIQHLEYQEQLKFKRELVFSTIKKYAGIETNVDEVVPSKFEFRYRNKFAFPVIQDENGNVKIGMYKRNSHDLIEIEDCLLQSERTKQIIKIFKEFMEEEKISAYCQSTGKGLVKHIVLRESDDEFLLTVVVTENSNQDFSHLYQKLSNHFKNFGIIKNVNNLKNNVIFGNLDLKLFGIDKIEKDEMGIKYSVSNRSFIQVNDYIKNLIYKTVLNEIDEGKIVVDAFSGAGLLSAIMAKKSQFVYGIEIEPQATKNANYLKNYNKIENLKNICGDCSKELPKLAKSLKDFILVLDPPRKGVMQPVIDAILTSKPKKIIYISCNPATLARDLKSLLEEYMVKKVMPFDMFPQTSQVETVAILSLNVGV